MVSDRTMGTARAPAEPVDEGWERREESLQVARAREGDSSAINWLLQRYRSRVIRLAEHVLRRPGEAEDVAQEAFIRAFRNLRHFRGDGRFYTWLYQIVVRLCIDRQRLARWDSELPIDTAMETRCGDDCFTSGTDLRITVETLLDRLSPPVRAILVLRELEGLEYGEIAQVLNIPIGRVKWRLHEARAQFAKLLGAAEREEQSV